MKIFCDGSRFYGSQIDRIELGFRQLGHEITPHVSDADLLYANDASHYKQIIGDRMAGRLKAGAKVIFTVLDLPFHIVDFNYYNLEKELLYADAVCSISKYVQWQLKSRLDQDSSVIYQPIKHISHLPTTGGSYRFLSVGRRSDANKRVNLWTHALQILGAPPRTVALVGEEPWWGDYQGILDDERLDALYNSVDFVLATGRLEGLNLPAIEAMAAGVIPVICADLTTREELFPSSIFPEYRDVHPTPESIAVFIAKFLNSNQAMNEMKNRLYKHYLENWKEKTSPAGVAKRILEVYEKL